MGLGPDVNSVIFRAFARAPAGASPLSRIFEQNTTSQNFLTLLLPRLNGTGDSFGSTGEVTISEIVTGYENVTHMPRLKVERLLDFFSADQHFQVITEPRPIIGPDGTPIAVSSIVQGAPQGRLVAVLDSGFTLPQVPRGIADAIYGQVKGARYDLENGWWTIPCDQYLNISFNFGGVLYPVHPLDVSSDSEGLRQGDTNCIGLFQPIGQGAVDPFYDMILGMAFLRNTYALFDFGNFVNASSNDRGAPFVQLLPLTTSDAAKEDFIRVRLGGNDTTGDSARALLPKSKGQRSPLRADEIETSTHVLVQNILKDVQAGQNLSVVATRLETAIGLLVQDARVAEQAELRQAAAQDAGKVKAAAGGAKDAVKAAGGALDESGEHTKQGIKKYWPYILAGGLALFCVIAGCIMGFCKRDGSTKSTWKRGGFMGGNSYKPLHAPAPPAMAAVPRNV